MEKTVIAPGPAHAVAAHQRLRDHLVRKTLLKMIADARMQYLTGAMRVRRGKGLDYAKELERNAVTLEKLAHDLKTNRIDIATVLSVMGVDDSMLQTAVATAMGSATGAGPVPVESVAETVAAEDLL